MLEACEAQLGCLVCLSFKAVWYRALRKNEGLIATRNVSAAVVAFALWPMGNAIASRRIRNRIRITHKRRTKNDRLDPMMRSVDLPSMRTSSAPRLECLSRFKVCFVPTVLKRLELSAAGSFSSLASG